MFSLPKVLNVHLLQKNQQSIQLCFHYKVSDYIIKEIKKTLLQYDQYGWEMDCVATIYSKLNFFKIYCLLINQ